MSKITEARKITCAKITTFTVVDTLTYLEYSKVSEMIALHLGKVMCLLDQLTTICLPCSFSTCNYIISFSYAAVMFGLNSTKNSAHHYIHYLNISDTARLPLMKVYTVFILIAAHAPISTHPSYFEVINHKIINHLPRSVH